MRVALLWIIAIAIAIAIAVGGCRVTGTFQCERGEQCRRGGETGRCEASGYCSFADGTCADGWRYDDLASSDLAGVCVDNGVTPSECFAGLAGGGAHVCALKLDGTVWCWGSNSAYQQTDGLPIGTTMTAMAVPSLSDIDRIAAGQSFTCVRRSSDKTVQCFGSNASGQIGNGGAAGTQVPTAPTALGPVTEISAGRDHACAITTGGAVYCWGSGGDGQVGDGGSTDRSTPQQVRLIDNSPLMNATSVAAGDFHSCAVSGGVAYCWGKDENGEVGNDIDLSRQDLAARVADLAGVTKIATGRSHTCASTTDGKTWCWGDNSARQLGDNSTIDRPTPVAVVGLPAQSVTAFALGDAHSCALLGGSLWCWGGNSLAQVTFPASASEATGMVSDLGAPSFIAVTSSNTCVISDTSVACRGANDQYQLTAAASLDTLPMAHPATTIALPCN